MAHAPWDPEWSTPVVGRDFETELAACDDPRLSPSTVRVLETGDGYPVIVVGVVHDHPASVYRARTVVDRVDPAVLAVELPDALVGLFGGYAASDDPRGCEMAAAIDSAGDADVVGIDAPSVASLGSLARELHDSDASVRAVARALGGFGRLVIARVRSQLSAAGVPSRFLASVPGVTQQFDCDAEDTPVDQATHESSHRRRSTSLLRSFRVPAATKLLDAGRERYMVRRLAAVREDRLVVAVVGFGHLDAVARGLATE